jgi:imidazolonepropionase-like amidohydrolase
MTMNAWLRVCVGATLLAVVPFPWNSPATDILPPGHRARPPGIHALVGGTVITQPGTVLSNATVVIRDGFIEAVGQNMSAPADARVWPMQGRTIYAGFIDAYLPLPATRTSAATAEETSSDFNDSFTAGGAVDFYGVVGQRTDRGMPGAGHAIARVTPERRAIQSYSPRERTLAPLRELGFTAGVVAPADGIIRGSSTLVALVEDNPNAVVLQPDVFQHVSFDDRGGPERVYPQSLMGIIAAVRQTFFDAQYDAQIHTGGRAHPPGRPRPEFNPAWTALRPAIEGRQRVLFEPGSALMGDRVRYIAEELKLDFAILACGQEWRRPDLLADNPATFIVPLHFPTLPALPTEDDWENVSLDALRAWDWAAENPAVLRREGREIALTTHGLSDKKSFRKNLRLALDRGLDPTDALAALTTVPAKLCGVDERLGTIAPGKIANLTVVDSPGYFAPQAKVRQVWIDGRVYRLPADTAKSVRSPTKEKSATTAAGEQKADPEARPAELRALRQQRVARSPLEGRGPLLTPAALLIENATVWTCGDQGVLTNARVWVQDGKVKAVGDFTLTSGADLVRIDARGRHVTPGLIDAHSHTAILGSVNESSIPSSAMCRIGDVVNSETRTLGEQLGGGLTMCNLYHGSANPIGGQDCIIKLRDGASPEGLKFDAAPPGLKMALGENVKQSGWGDRYTTRFPQSRMGVPTFIANRYRAAQEYLRAVERAEASGEPRPRRDLELEALAEILQGRRWIHCHAYRQDEMLALLRVMESFGVRIASMEHVLEGYKIADEIVAHGLGPSCFADWWAYKFEVYDAIPYNGALLHERGALVSFNSDSSDLARRLNTEAAKAVKFGGTPEIEALKFVTINPAKQLKIDARVGSLEPGKDADLVIWSGPPLDSRSVALQTWIDGKKYFDREQAAARAAARQQEREALLAKAKKVRRLEAAGGGGERSAKDGDTFFRVAWEQLYEGVDREAEAEGL